MKSVMAAVKPIRARCIGHSFRDDAVVGAAVIRFIATGRVIQTGGAQPSVDGSRELLCLDADEAERSSERHLIPHEVEPRCARVLGRAADERLPTLVENAEVPD